MSSSCALLIVVVGVFIASPLRSQSAFTIETVDAVHDAGYHASLALDSEGLPHIAYVTRIGPGDEPTLYATKVNGEWAIETTAALGLVRFGLELIMTAGDVPALSKSGLYHERVAGIWSTELMTGFSPWYSVICVDDAGVVHGMTQWSWGTGDYHGHIDYDVRSGGIWSGEGVTGAAFIPVAPHASMMMDALGDPHISMTTTDGDFLQYWHRKNGVWAADTIAVGTWSSLALDEQGRPMVAYYDSQSQDLVIAMRSGSEWTSVAIDQTGDVGLYASQVYRNGTSHVSYYDGSLGELRYATYSLSNGISVTTVDSSGDVGQFTSLEIDQQDRVHVAYRDATNGSLKYAVQEQSVSSESTTLGNIKHRFRK